MDELREQANAAQAETSTLETYTKFWASRGREVFETIIRIFEEHKTTEMRGTELIQELKEKYGMSDNSARLSVHVSAKKGLLRSEGFGPNHRYILAERVWERVDATPIEVRPLKPRQRRLPAGRPASGPQTDQRTEILQKVKRVVPRVQWDKFAEDYLRERWGARPFDWDSVKLFIRQIVPQEMWDDFAIRWIEKQPAE